MKQIKIIMTGTGIVATACIYLSCSKANLDRVAASDNDFSNKAVVQVYDAALNTQRNFIYADGKPLSGAAMVYTQTTATNAAFTGSGLSFALAPGLHNLVIRDTLATSTQPVLSFAANFDANKFYTIFTYDSLNGVKQKTVEAEIVIPTDTVARVRFAHFAYLKTGVTPNVDVFSTKRNANVWSDIPYTTVTNFIPYASGASDSLIVRQAGTLTGLDTAIFSFVKRRSYTLVFRGRYTVNESGGVNYPRLLTSFANN
jgi:hypothetical protein